MPNPVRNPSKAKKTLEKHAAIRAAVSIGAVVAGVLGALELLKIMRGQ